MKIEAYIVTYNDERILPYTLRHYKQFADIIIVDNNSSDRTIDIATESGVIVRSGDMPDELNEFKLVEIKNNCWKDSDADRDELSLSVA